MLLLSNPHPCVAGVLSRAAFQPVPARLSSTLSKAGQRPLNGENPLIEEEIYGQDSLIDTEDMLPSAGMHLPAGEGSLGSGKLLGYASGSSRALGPGTWGQARPGKAGTRKDSLEGPEVPRGRGGRQKEAALGTFPSLPGSQTSLARAKARRAKAFRGREMGYESSGTVGAGAGRGKDGGRSSGSSSSSAAGGSVPKRSQADFEIWHLDGARDMKESLSSRGATPALPPLEDAASPDTALNGTAALEAEQEYHRPVGEPKDRSSDLGLTANDESRMMELAAHPDIQGDGEAHSWDSLSGLEMRDVMEGGKAVEGGGNREGQERGEASPVDAEAVANPTVADAEEGGRQGAKTTSAFAPKAPEILTIAKEPVYQVLEVNVDGHIQQREVSRRQLVRFSGLSQRDIRRIDPSLWMTNSMPALLVRDNAILLKLGSLRAISTARAVLIFDFNSAGAQSFLNVLMERLRMDADAQANGGVPVPFELEVVESALISRTQRLESALMDVEPRVLALLEALPTSLTADNLEELRLCKQALVELGAKAGSLREMLIELLEQTTDLRRITALGRHCRVDSNGALDCSTSSEKSLAEEEQQEVEMLLEYYLQRCDSVHGQAEKLLDSAKETEDSLAVNLSSRRLEVSRLELLLQVATFAAALGALVAGIFGMNLRNRLEENATAFWLTTFGIIAGGLLLFIGLFMHLRRRNIL